MLDNELVDALNKYVTKRISYDKGNYAQLRWGREDEELKDARDALHQELNDFIDRRIAKALEQRDHDARELKQERDNSVY